MPKLILPFHAAAAAGKNGSSENSIIYARTSAECEAQKMVTYTKAYKSPVQPNSALQLSARDKLRQIVLSLKNLSPYFVPGSLYGTLPVLEGTFKSDRTRFISNCMRYGVLLYHNECWLDNSESAFKIKVMYDDLFQAYFNTENIFFAVQIRGDVVDKAFYRDYFKSGYDQFDSQEEIYDRDIHRLSRFKTFTVDETDFDGGKAYTARLWAAPVAFPEPPSNNQVDATSTWDIGSSVRMDFLFNIIA